MHILSSTDAVATIFDPYGIMNDGFHLTINLKYNMVINLIRL